ncbi:MAG: proline--tRNA ligase [Clostridiaceae bacterium]|nr:proline--tRNA ligase [Clostridiaceae bacterium]
MRLSRDYFFTLRDDVKNEDSVSGNLLVRSGMIKKTSSGIYMMLPLGLRVMNKIENVVREEMNAIHSLELSMPAMIPEEVYIESGRRETFGKSMFGLKDRFNKPFVLGPTHEELFAAAAKMHVHSYKDLPISLYQFQTKFRDEPRPRFGLIRVREFVMKDAYTFDRDLAGLDVAYDKMFQAYKNIFDRLEIDYVIVRADTGVMGGLLSEEFQAVCDIGEDILVIEESSGYASNLEIAKCVVEDEISTEQELTYDIKDTPEAKTIEEVVAFLNEDIKKFVKTLIYKIDGKIYALCVRGDHEVNETKVLKLLGANEIEMASEEEVVASTKAPVGFAGPIDLEIPIIMDQELTVMKNFIVGANQVDKHFINVNLSDFTVTQVADIRKIQEGDMCENGAGPVKFMHGIEIGNTFKLGDGYAKAMDLYYTDQNNKLIPVQMGSYGIGIARCMAAIVEQNHDEHGILWPKHLAPVQVAIVIINTKNAEQVEVAEKLYAELSSNTKLDVLIDDRDERAGVKFNDMELIGAYARITVGRGIADGKVELKIAGSDSSEDVAIEKITTKIKEIFAD